MQHRVISWILLVVLLVGILPLGVLSQRASASGDTLPVITLASPSVSFEDDVFINLYFSISDARNIPLRKMGMITFRQKVENGTVDNADAVIPGAVYENSLGLFRVHSQGIAAKELGDEVYFRVYAQLADGTYIYSRMAHYSPKKYAYNMLKSNQPVSMKTLAVAMLKYGAAAQTYFGYKTDALVDGELTQEQSNLVALYREDMVEPMVKALSGKCILFQNNNGFSKKNAGITMGSAFSINYALDISHAPDGEVRLYYWDQETYENVPYLTVDNASGSCVMSGIRRYYAKIPGIAAKDLGKTFYAAAVYEKDGETMCSGVTSYSVGTYCLNKAGGSDEALRKLSGAIAVYGYYAKNYIEGDNLQEYAKKIEAVQTPSTLTLAVMSDSHYCSEEKEAKSVRDCANKMSMLSRYVHVDAIANLGDFVRGDEVKETTVSDLQTLLTSTHENADCPVFYIRGNHDDNGWYSLAGSGNPGSHLPEEIINDREWYELAFGITAKDVVTDPARPYGGYGYYDHEASKIRVFLLNTVDIPYILEEDGTYRYNSYECYAFSSEQLNFVADALRFSDKEAPGEWAALFLTHVPLDTTNNDGYRFGGKDALVRGYQQMLAIVDAYRKGLFYSFSGSVNNISDKDELPEDFVVDVKADYTQKGVGDVIGFIYGHNHTDNASQKVGYEDSLSHGYTFISNIGMEAFTTFVVDRSKNTITAFKYGEVRPQSDAERFNPGAVDGEAELGIDMSDGVWEIPFDQFRPTGENLWNGLSDLWGDGYTSCQPATLNLRTLEVSTATANEKYAMSKAVKIRATTQYEIPKGFVGTILRYAKNGTFNGTLTPVEVDGKKIITTGTSGGYLVFVYHKRLFPQYRDFYITECCYGL